jgi:hypothetical protein
VPGTRIRIPLSQRKLDRLLVFAFATFAFTSFAFDRLSAQYADLEAQRGFFVEYLVRFGRTVDPLLIANPMWLRLMCGLSAFVFGPFYLVLVVGLVRGDDRIRVPGLVYAAVMSYSLVVHLGVELLGELPPLNMPVFAATYVPYVVFPLLLAWRLRAPHPFTRPVDERGS